MRGYCPTCNAKIIASTRGGPNAMHTCENGHKHPWHKSLPVSSEILENQPSNETVPTPTFTTSTYPK